MRLKDKVAIVTGAADGIGKGIAMAFARQGTKLAVCDINRVELDKTEQLLREFTPEVLACQLDVGESDAVRRFVQQVIEHYGRIDILVNNAAVMPVAGFVELSEVDIDRILAVNFKAAVIFSQQVIPHMQQVGGGSIIHMSSITGHRGFPGIVVYGGVKGALIALARGQAVEFGPYGIRVNTVSPGTVDSPMLHRYLEEDVDDPQAEMRKINASHPRGCVAEIEEVASVFVFLASDESVNVTGVDILCDGGQAAAGTNMNQ